MILFNDALYEIWIELSKMHSRYLTEEEIKYLAENCIKDDCILYLTKIPERWQFFEEIRDLYYCSEESSNAKFEDVCKENFLILDKAITEIEKITGNKILFIVDSPTNTSDPSMAAFYFDGWRKYLAEFDCEALECKIEDGVATFTFSPYRTHLLTDMIAKVYQHRIETGEEIHQIQFSHPFEIII